MKEIIELFLKTRICEDNGNKSVGRNRWMRIRKGQHENLMMFQMAKGLIWWRSWGSGMYRAHTKRCHQLVSRPLHLNIWGLPVLAPFPLVSSQIQWEEILKYIRTSWNLLYGCADVKIMDKICVKLCVMIEESLKVFFFWGSRVSYLLEKLRNTLIVCICLIFNRHIYLMFISENGSNEIFHFLILLIPKNNVKPQLSYLKLYSQDQTTCIWI